MRILTSPFTYLYRCNEIVKTILNMLKMLGRALAYPHQGESWILCHAHCSENGICHKMACSLENILNLKY
jgi:hypothetical protein